MAESLNKVILIGNVGDDPRIVELKSGSKKLASFSLATSESWVDVGTKEKQTRTDWHRIVVYGEGLVSIIEKINIKKGAKLFIEGKLVTRKWVDKSGNNRSTVEVVLQGYNCSLIVLSSGGQGGNYRKNEENTGNNAFAGQKNFEENIEDDFDDFMNTDFGPIEDDKLMF